MWQPNHVFICAVFVLHDLLAIDITFRFDDLWLNHPFGAGLEYLGKYQVMAANQATILHMPQYFNYRDMCKFLTWLEQREKT